MLLFRCRASNPVSFEEVPRYSRAVRDREEGRGSERREEELVQCAAFEGLHPHSAPFAQEGKGGEGVEILKKF